MLSFRTMSRQSNDPLADTIPRYTFEDDSEEEEDEFNPFPESLRAVLEVTKSESDANIVIDFGDNEKILEKVTSVVFASGALGEVWASGANLGAQLGRVTIDGKEVAKIYRPTWLRYPVVISDEVIVPPEAIYPFAMALTKKWDPSRIIILHAYNAATYITSGTKEPAYEAPLRYLHSGSDYTAPPASFKFKTFDPPNLIQGIPASLISVLTLPRNPPRAVTAILYPVLQALPSQSLTRTTESVAPDHDEDEDWNPFLLEQLQSIVSALTGTPTPKAWESNLKAAVRHAAKKRPDVDSIMYI